MELEELSNLEHVLLRMWQVNTLLLSLKASSCACNSLKASSFFFEIEPPLFYNWGHKEDAKCKISSIEVTTSMLSAKYQALRSQRGC